MKLSELEWIGLILLALVALMFIEQARMVSAGEISVPSDSGTLDHYSMFPLRLKDSLEYAMTIQK